MFKASAHRLRHSPITSGKATRASGSSKWIVASFVAVVCAAVSGCDPANPYGAVKDDKVEAARQEVSKIAMVIMDAAATPKPDLVRADVKYLNEKYGADAVVTATKQLIEEDKKLKPIAAYFLRFLLPEDEFAAYLKPLVTGEEFDRVMAAPF